MPVTLLLITVGIFLLWLGWRFNWGGRRRKSAAKSADSGAAGGSNRRCPLCQSALKNGERIKSATFFPRSAERIIAISGCRHCITGGRRRLCPVCGRTLTPEETLTAKMSVSPTGTQVRIFGCPHCLKR
ncbi:MAG: hypothetical protein LBO67_04160 [Spirochaetaceae bacterium]|nr:hypothetical protein [Spirochaetaceae bacterium]